VINAPIANTGYYTINVTYNNSVGSNPANNAQVTLIFSAASLPTPGVGHMYIDITMQPNINEQIVNDMMEDMCENLQTITHLVNHVEFQANVAGVILADGEDILPAMTGDLMPAPQEGV
jgi:hypothetical protein